MNELNCCEVCAALSVPVARKCGSETNHACMYKSFILQADRQCTVELRARLSRCARGRLWLLAKQSEQLVAQRTLRLGRAARGSPRAGGSGVGRFAGRRALDAFDFAHELVERFLDVGAQPCARLDVGGANRLGPRARLVGRHGAQVLEVAFVANHDERDAPAAQVLVFHARNLLGKRGQVVKRGPVGQVKDHQEALASAHVLRGEGA